MRFITRILLSLILLAATLANAQAPPFQHIVVIVQENRTPDNLFGNSPNFESYLDIQPAANSQIVSLASCINPDHTHHPGFTNDLGNNWCKLETGCTSLSCPAETIVNASQVTPYINIAQYYGFANRMFQTNQGPSFPAHQFLLSGTSAPTADTSGTDYANWFAAENNGNTKLSGCITTSDQVVLEIDPASDPESPGYSPPTMPQRPDAGYPCYEHPTLTDLLKQHSISWKYYAPVAGDIWTAPNAIEHMCVPSGFTCTGSDWQNVILDPPQVIVDINNPNCSLSAFPQVSWVIPSGAYSDHGHKNLGYGPQWVANIVNAIGTSPCGYWNNTAIFITWDDWGGFYDHVPPPTPRNQYELGFRVPLLVVSPYTPAGFVSCPAPVDPNCKYADFGSILRFVESNFGLPFIAPFPLQYADQQAKPMDPGFFGLPKARQFEPIPNLSYDSTFFTTNQVNPNLDPDDD
jgi:phospholipase C